MSALDHASHFVRHGLSTALFGCVIAAALTLGGNDRWDNNLVYSLSIAMLSWLLIDLGRVALTGRLPIQWPHGWRGILLVAIGVSLGFLGGTAIGDVYTGQAAWSRLNMPQKLVPALVISVIASIVITYYYYSRGKSSYLLSQIATAQRDAAEARLKLLETQLEPHMLFNTLANLRVLIQVDPPRAISMLDHLNNYLRVTLTGSRVLAHPLAAEFARLGDFLELMAIRMGPRLRYTLDLPDDLRDVPVPPLLLQPLVENAIRHGLEPQVEGGEITVRARRQAGSNVPPQVAIEVCDTGVGLGTAPASDGSGFGVAQVRERLATTYGNRGTMELVAAAAGGTRATVTFPL